MCPCSEKTVGKLPHYIFKYKELLKIFEGIKLTVPKFSKHLNEYSEIFESHNNIQYVLKKMY